MQNEKTEPISIDVNCSDFYNKLQNERDADLARLKKNVEIFENLRLDAIQMEVETAALYHAELLQNIEELEALNKKFEEDVSNSK